MTDVDLNRYAICGGCAGAYPKRLSYCPSCKEPNDQLKVAETVMEKRIDMPGALASGTQVGGSHYSSMAIQPAEFIHKNGIGFLAGNVIKYVSRYKAKGGKQDLEKAGHYVRLLIEKEYPE